MYRGHENVCQILLESTTVDVNLTDDQVRNLKENIMLNFTHLEQNKVKSRYAKTEGLL